VLFGVNIREVSVRAFLLFLVVISLAGCNSSNPSPSPVTTTTLPPPVNRAPVINSAQVSPPWGISSLVTHAFTSSASDPDGDSITYSWDFGNGTQASGASASVTYNNANTVTYQATLTVADSRGLSVMTTVPVTSVTIAGSWSGEILPGVPLTASMTQFVGGLITGTWDVPGSGIGGEIGPTGEPGMIQASGQFELRFKARSGGAFEDFHYRGNIDPTGQMLTGTLHGSGFTGEYMGLTKQ
jgi:hypothetical protein